MSTSISTLQTRDGTAEPVSLDQILRREQGQGKNHFSCSADHEQDWQPYPVDPYSCLYVMAIHLNRIDNPDGVHRNSSVRRAPLV